MRATGLTPMVSGAGLKQYLKATEPRVSMRNATAPFRYVGDLGVGLGEVLGRRAQDNFNDWFEGAEVFYVHTARTAIQQACSLLQLEHGGEVLVPAYNCGSEVDALLAGGATVRLFRVTNTGEIDLEDVRQRITRATRALYVIHYFGFPQAITPISEFCKEKGLHLMEDCALSTLTEVNGRRIGQAGDLAVYNFPKVLPVPDGGAMVINNRALPRRTWLLKLPKLMLSDASRLLRQSLLRALPNAAARILDCLIRNRAAEELPSGPGRREMPRSYYSTPFLKDRSISKVSAFLMSGMSFSEIRARRRRNFSLLLQLLSRESGLTPLYRELPDGVCPLCLPILVGPARKLAARLASFSIPAVPWWSGYNAQCKEWDAFPEACYLKDHMVALPVHQQLNDSAMQYIAKRVTEGLQSA